MEIRVATEKDAKAVSSLYHELFLEMVGQQPANMNADVFSETFPQNVIDDENGDIMVAVENDEIVGFMHLQVLEAPTFGPYLLRKYCVIISIGVHAAYRGIGIGSKLLESAKDWTRERRLDYIQVDLLVENKATFHIYEKAGFQTSCTPCGME
jgi:ribosomal protein S18 acetylase RimI-like enzyme